MGIGALFAWFTGSLDRWVNPDTWKAILWAGAVIIVAGGLLYWHGDMKRQAAAVATAQCDAKYLAQRIAESTAAAQAAADTARAVANAADLARLKADGERDQAIARAIDLENTLAALKDNPIVWPRDIARELRK